MFGVRPQESSAGCGDRAGVGSIRTGIGTGMGMSAGTGTGIGSGSEPYCARAQPSPRLCVPGQGQGQELGIRDRDRSGARLQPDLTPPSNLHNPAPWHHRRCSGSALALPRPRPPTGR